MEERMPTRVMILEKVVHPELFFPEPETGAAWRLYLHWVRYMHEDGGLEHGFRFMWRRPDGSLQAARGQARIPSLDDVDVLLRLARQEPWGKNAGERA